MALDPHSSACHFLPGVLTEDDLLHQILVTQVPLGWLPNVGRRCAGFLQTIQAELAEAVQLFCASYSVMPLNQEIIQNAPTNVLGSKFNESGEYAV